MASLRNSKTVTYEEWLRMPEVSGAIEEVVNGEIRIMPPPKWKHSKISNRLAFALQAQVNALEVTVMVATFGLIIRRNPLTAREPDLAMFHNGTIVEEDGYVHSAPQLAVEVLSPANTRKERQEKLADYTEFGIPEVWVISPEALTVEVLILEDGHYRPAAVLVEGILKPRHFPNVQIDIAKIWPD